MTRIHCSLTPSDEAQGQSSPDRSRARPRGTLSPPDDCAARAIAAIDERRFADAEGHIAALPDTPMIVRAWKLLCSALLAGAQGKVRDAENSFQRAFALAYVAGAATSIIDEHRAAAADEMQNSEDRAAARRLAAKCLHHIGWAYRRQDRSEDALRTHLVAYQLRTETGSAEDQWETAIELALDFEVARRFEESQTWFARAAGLAELCDDALRRQAVAWTGLANTRCRLNDNSGAVEAARTARDLWHRHDPGAVTATQADARFAAALLGLADSLLGRDAEKARRVLLESVEQFEHARESLLAFGSSWAVEATSCEEQRDVAQRMLAALDNDTQGTGR